MFTFYTEYHEPFAEYIYLLYTIYHWKGNLSKSPIHFRYRQNIFFATL